MRSLSVLAVVVAASLGAAGVSDTERRTPAQSMRDSVLSAERRFLGGWASRWKESHRRDAGPNTIVRHATLRCARWPEDRRVWKNSDRYIKSKEADFTICPSWFIEPVDRSDEGVTPDFAIDPEFREDIRASRETLIEVLENAHRINRADDFVRGQLVRFLVDHGEYERARSKTEGCGTAAWWCEMLQGYVLARIGESVTAEAAYTRALALMPSAERCTWQDVSPLLDDESAKRFRAMKCADRAPFVAQMWWLADPLFSEPGNARRLEHFVRQTMVALRVGLDEDERYDWNPKSGGDTRVQLMLRYGVPSYTYWGADAAGVDWTIPRWGIGLPPDRKLRWMVLPQSPHTTYEYSPGRLHTIPSLAAVRDPFHAATSEWFIHDTVSVPAASWRDERWWPREHFNPARPLIQLHEHQAAFLRRQDSLLLAVAAALPTDALSRVNGSRINHVYLVRSPAQDSVEIIGDRPGFAGIGAAVWAHVPPEPSLFGLEFEAATSFKPGGRTRFGATPPEPLSALKNGKVAISDPVVLLHSGDTTALPVHTDSALAHMAPTNRVQAAGKIGIYWETYGFAASDTMQLAVWVERHTPQGVGRKLTNALQFTRDLNTPIAVNWVETPASPRTHVIPGPVRVVGRSISVDVSGLPKGSYWLDVAATARGREIVRGRRVLIVQ